MRIAEEPVVDSNKERSLQALVLISAGLSGLSIALYGGLSSWVARDLELRDVHSGLAQAVFYLGNLFAVAFAGRLAARYSLGLLWPAALILISVGNLSTGSPRFETLLFGRCVAGVGISMLFLVLTAFVVRRWPLQRVRFLSLMHATTALSASLSLALGRFLAESLGGWKPVFWICATGTFVLALRLRWFKIPSYHHVDRVSNNPQAAADAIAAVPSIPLGRVIAILWGYVAVEQALTVFLPAFGERAFAINPAKASMLAALLWGGVIAGRLAAASLPNLPERPLLIFGAIGMSYALLLALGAADEKSMAVCVFFAGLLGGPIVPAGYGLASRVSGGSNALPISLCQLGCGLGGFGGPFFVGLAGESLGLTVGLGWLAFILLGSALILLVPILQSKAKFFLASRSSFNKARVVDSLVSTS